MTLLAETNKQVLNLVEALAGAVSPNFRRVTLTVSDPATITIEFVLEVDDATDREEIDDVLFELEALQDTNSRVIRAEVFVDAGPLGDLDAAARIVYARRE